MKTQRKPQHPGAIFKRNILEPAGLTITDGARYLGITRKTLSEFTNAKARCSLSMAKRIAQATDSSVTVWINLQANYDAWEAQHIQVGEVRRFPVEAENLLPD